MAPCLPLLPCTATCVNLFLMLRFNPNYFYSIFFRIKLTFMAPCLPLLPCTAICINLFLMLRLHPDAWKRLAIWVAAGELVG